MDSNATSTLDKALRINRDAAHYGSFAEIGAGQEVVRWFFSVGGAAGTVAKSMSAYDMKFSDAIYGPTSRYVSRSRLSAMLNHEYQLLIERLDSSQGERTPFFTFANTVAASSFIRQKEGNGWMGVRFQRSPRASPDEIIIHVRLLDRDNQKQQHLLGILGVNLLYGAFFYADDPQRLISLLRDELGGNHFEIDLIHFSGPSYHKCDNRRLNLYLVQCHLSNAVLFGTDGQAIQAGDILHKKPVILERGTFRPITRATLEVLRCSLEEYSKQVQVEQKDIAVLMEMSIYVQGQEEDFDEKDFWERFEMLQVLGHNVLVSSYSRDFGLAAYLAGYTQAPIGFAMGLSHLKMLFDEGRYGDLEGGILESFGRLFKKNVTLYIYPMITPEGFIETADTFEVAPHLKPLYRYLIENHYLLSIQGIDPEVSLLTPQKVLAKIHEKDPSWQKHVPLSVAHLINSKGYFRNSRG